MPLARIGTIVMFFAHIPKTGGSSVETYLSRKGAVALRYPRRLGWSKTTAQHMDAAVHQALVPDAFIDCSFAVLRDPVARLISEYRYRADRRAGVPPFDVWVERMFSKYAQNPATQDNHIRPQVDFLRPGMRLFHLEDGLTPVFDWIDMQSGTSAADRDVWDKKSKSAAIELSADMRARIERFYHADIAQIARARAQGGAATYTKENAG